MRLLTFLSVILFSLVTANAKSPNFVFILADDLGRQDINIEGSTYHETPHIDRIAKEGMRFTNGYATCQVCSPSRASIQLGTYPARNKITDWIGARTGYSWNRNDKVLPVEYEHQLPHDETTIAEAMKAGGYKTFFAGKWHLGDEGSFPEDHGYEINKGGHHRGSPPGGFFSPYKNPKLEDGPDGESLPIRLGKETAAFIDQNQESPFFAFLSFYSVHSPIQTTPELWQKYRDKAAQDPMPSERFMIDRTLPVRQVQDCPIYAGMMELMDDAVGIVLDKLDELKLADNTVVIFTSDNGGVSSGDAFSTCNLPFRGGKGRQWEGGIREPYYIKAPGITKPGATCDTPVTGTDFYPTILELAGMKLMPKQHQDGVSLVPLLKGETIAERNLFWHYPHYGNQGGEPSSIIRNENWKLIHYWEDGREELYNLEEDIEEQHNVAESYPDKVQSLHEELFSWLGSVQARIPGVDPRYDAEKDKQSKINMRTKRKPQLEKQHARFLDPDFQPNKDWWGSKVTKD